MTENKKSKPKKARQRINFVVEKLMDQKTGELKGCLIPSHAADSRAMKECKYSVGTVLSAELRLVRNVLFWRFAHILGGWLADNADQFTGLTQHGAIKKLQDLSQVGVYKEVFDLGNLGKIERTVSLSLAFDEMEEGEFRQLWDSWLDWIRHNLYGGMSEDQMTKLVEMIERDAVK